MNLIWHDVVFKVILLGNLGRDPELRFMPNGDAVCNFSIATTDSWKDKAGEKQERTEWHNIVMYRKLAELHEQIVVKLPMTKEGVQAAKYFSDKGIKTNVTLVFSAGQALLAAKAGATYVSPFLGRLDDVSTDGLNLIQEIRDIYDNYGYETQILAASVRHTMHVVNCAKIGADVMTGPLSSIAGLLKHPLTDIGLAQFVADFEKGNK